MDNIQHALSNGFIYLDLLFGRIIFFFLAGLFLYRIIYLFFGQYYFSTVLFSLLTGLFIFFLGSTIFFFGRMIFVQDYLSFFWAGFFCTGLFSFFGRTIVCKTIFVNLALSLLILPGSRELNFLLILFTQLTTIIVINSIKTEWSAVARL